MRIYAVSVFLVHRFVVGVALGATVAPTPAGSRALVGFLAAAFLALLLFVALMRPFLVPIANVFEGPVEILQDTLFFSDRARCIAQLRPWVLITAQCSAKS